MKPGRKSKPYCKRGHRQISSNRRYSLSIKGLVVYQCRLCYNLRAKLAARRKKYSRSYLIV